MERDFIGILGRNSGDDATASRHEAAVPSVKWPFSSMVSSTPQYILPKTPQEEKPRKHVFNNHSSLRLNHISMDGLDVNLKTPHGLAAQKCVDLDKQSFSQYPRCTYQPFTSDSFASSLPHLDEIRMISTFSDHGLPGTGSSPFSNIQHAHNVTVASPKQRFLDDQIGHCNFVGEPSSLNIFWPINMTGQLTIFHDGYVNVYDDVSSDKVQEILSLASQGSNMTPNVMNQTTHAPGPATLVAPIRMTGSIDSRTKRQEGIIPMSMLPNLGVLPSGTSHSAASSRGGLRMNNDAADSKGAVQLVPASQQEAFKTLSAAFSSETAGTTLPKAVPQARKASLARFLEKRKERLTSAIPYSCSKMNRENGSGLESSNMSSISSSSEINNSYNQKD
ncbi:protein TIFY 6b-like isoform X1 [Zingiber officinale]|uniref:protein TIFY 6b-like isoform X1 n=1 Tax=Zingiber officinale TaxID=94328 RepID=UPI001C4CED2D|nr:protein TIFY 6b-like isoform X1 [Zingiber officinale]